MRRLVASLLCLGLAAPAGSFAHPQPSVPGADLVPTPFAALAGWPDDDHVGAYAAFLKSCTPIRSGTVPPRMPAGPLPALKQACDEAAAQPVPGPDDARRFFERRFAAFEVRPVPPARSFLTGYYEPEFDGSSVRSDRFTAPLLARPDDLVTLNPDEPNPGLPPGLTAARRTAPGLEPYPDRAAIQAGAVDGLTRPILYLRDEVDVFIVQVQGSARIRLEDGRVVRVAYAGRNGWPYTSVARLLVEKLGLSPAEMTASVLTSWLRANRAEGQDLLRRNRSYVFFRMADELDPADGPLGAAGVPVTPGRTLAVDRSIWTYGLPVWLEAELPESSGQLAPLRRLTVAQDTGSAIVGVARGDLFVGSGPEAGLRAGLIRHPVRFVVLWPKAEPGYSDEP